MLDDFSPGDGRSHSLERLPGAFQGRGQEVTIHWRTKTEQDMDRTAMRINMSCYRWHRWHLRYSPREKLATTLFTYPINLRTFPLLICLTSALDDGSSLELAPGSFAFHFQFRKGRSALHFF